MNAARRKAIMEAITHLEEAKSLLDTAASEERDYYDNMPESFQNGEKGSAADAAATALEEAVTSIDDAIASAETATE